MFGTPNSWHSLVNQGFPIDPATRRTQIPSKPITKPPNKSNKSPMKKPFQFLSALALVSLIASTDLQSAVVVNWNGDYVTSAAGFQSGGFTGGDPNILSPASGYTGPAFYGTSSDGGSVANFSTASPDRITPTASVGADFLWLFLDDNYLAGFNGFTASDTVTLNQPVVGGFTESRLILRVGTSYYASSTAVFSDSGTVNPTSLSYVTYDPATSLDTFGSAATIVSGGEILNVTEVGIFSESAGTGVSRWNQFTVNMSVPVPEPTTSVMLLIGGFGMAYMMRRRRA